jgi:hypothetical protein
MTESVQLKKGMIVRIDPKCELSRQWYEFDNQNKISLLGTLQRIQEINQISSTRLRITIENWFFDSRDLKAQITEEDLLSGIDPTILEKNKEDKPKIYFNPEQL